MAKRFDQFDIEELAAQICGFDVMDDYDMEEVERKLIEKYNIDLSYFSDLINDLSPLLDMAVSPITEEPFIGFGTGKMWIAKRPFPQFINQVLNWMDAEKVSKPTAKGYERIITKEGKPEFKLILNKVENEVSIGTDSQPLYVVDSIRKYRMGITKKLRNELAGGKNFELQKSILQKSKELIQLIKKEKEVTNG